MSDYSIANTPFQRDICRELADAVHRHGLKLGWYYSTRDWYHPDYLVGDNSKYNDFYHGQLRELLSNYGEVALLWFDHVSGTWADYRFRELFDMIYDLQPGILVNNRAARFVFGHKAGQPDPEIAELVKGDFDTPEGRIGVFQADRPWESCIHMSKLDTPGGWSYRPAAVTSSFADCAKMLAACVTGCGNLLMNIGPMANGQIRPEELENLKAFEPWMATYGESIYNTRGGPYINGKWGGATIRDNDIYLHIYEWNDGRLILPPLPRDVLACKELGGEHVTCDQDERGLILTRIRGKQEGVHSVVKLQLEPGALIPFIAVDGSLAQELRRMQHAALANPMK